MSLRFLLDRMIPSVKLNQRHRMKSRPSTCRLAVELLEDRRVPAAVFTVGDLIVAEGNGGTDHAMVAVTLSEPHGNRVTVNYNTADGTAKAGSDYDAVSGKLTFAKGQTSKSIVVPLHGNRAPGADETFFIRLSNAKGAKIVDGEGIITIVDDEPRLRINDLSVLEGNSGATPVTFTASLSAAYDLPVSVSYTTTDGSATAGNDYEATAGTVTFEPGQTSETITVLVTGDRLPEPDKTLLVSLSSPSTYAAISKAVGMGTIIDNEPRISIADVWNYGETSFTFTVSLSAAYDQEVTVNFATADGTALAGVDYVATSGTLTFASGETTKTITVDVLDTTAQPDKWFTIQLGGASTNALVPNEVAYGYWYYDDGYYDCGCYDYGYYDYGYYDYGYYW